MYGLWKAGKMFTFLYKQSEELLVKIKRYTNRLTSVLTSMGISTG